VGFDEAGEEVIFYLGCGFGKNCLTDKKATNGKQTENRKNKKISTEYTERTDSAPLPLRFLGCLWMRGGEFTEKEFFVSVTPPPRLLPHKEAERGR
jgi:hypothetical protein